MTVSIILITYNSWHVLPMFFKGLELADYPFSLYVVDNFSQHQPDLDRVVSVGVMNNNNCRQISLIKNKENLMYTKAANQGMIVADGELFLLMNPDCYGVDSGWLKKMIEYWEQYRPDVAGYKLVRPDLREIEHAGAHAPGVHEGKGEQDNGQYDEPRELMRADQYVTGACWMIAKTTIDKYGLLPEEHVHYASDREYCFNVRNNGGHIWYFPTKMVHMFGKSCL